MSLFLLWVLVAQTPDTVTLTAGDALARSLQASPVVEAARSRTLAAEFRTRQAGAFPNPTLTAAAENIGATEQTTGRSAPEGIEGQILLGTRIPIGGDRGAAVRRARASAEEAEALERVAELGTGVRTVDAIARLIHDRALVHFAVTDAEGIQQLADETRLQAELGRAPEGDAARLRLASASAWSRVATRRAEAARSGAELARLIGLDPGTPVSVELPTCSWEVPDLPASMPEVAALDAQARGWEATASELKARAIPDLLPQVGWRRSAGFDALYLGVQIELPIFDRGQGARGAARREAEAATHDREALISVSAAERLGAQRALEALREAGSGFDASWTEALVRSLESAEARYALGEGTLTELLDGRRARFDALADFEAWRMALFGWRARHARYSGAEIDRTLLCDPSPPFAPQSKEARRDDSAGDFEHPADVRNPENLK